MLRIRVPRSSAGRILLILEDKMIQQLTEAIQNKLQLRIFYDPGERLIEPHTLGYSANRNLLLRAFQVSGASSSNEHRDWKLFRLDRIGSLEPTDGSFDSPRTGYKRGDPAMKGGIIEEL